MKWKVDELHCGFIKDRLNSLDYKLTANLRGAQKMTSQGSPKKIHLRGAQ